MIVLKDLSGGEIPKTNMFHIALDELSQPSDSVALLYGYKHLFSDEVFDKIRDYKRKIYFQVTMPTEFSTDQDIDLDNKFDEVYTICPYSIKWLNTIKETDRYRFIWYPFPSKDIPPIQHKLYDVCYHGGLHGPKYIDMLNVLSNFNYRYMSLTYCINPLTYKHLNYATDTDLTNDQKMNRIAQCKISVCFNHYPVTEEHKYYIKNKKEWILNEAFIEIDKLDIVPQIKSRINEAAAARTLNLVQKDSWNIIEKFYNPDEHFIYFNNMDDLKSKIQTICNNWDSYAPVTERAYNRFVSNFTTEHLYQSIATNKVRMS